MKTASLRGKSVDVMGMQVAEAIGTGWQRVPGEVRHSVAAAGGGEGGQRKHSTSTLPRSPPEEATQEWGLHQGSSAALWDNIWESRFVQRQTSDGGVD